MYWNQKLIVPPRLSFWHDARDTCPFRDFEMRLLIIQILWINKFYFVRRAFELLAKRFVFKAIVSFGDTLFF